MPIENPAQYHESGPMRIEGLFEPSAFEAFDLVDFGDSPFPLVIGLVRWPSGTRIKASCIEGGYPLAEISKVHDLDRTHRFTGPVISSQEPAEPGVVMAHVKYAPGTDVYIIKEGYDGKCGIYDVHVNPFGYIDEEDAALRAEALNHMQERDTLQARLAKSKNDLEIARILLSGQEFDIEHNQKEIEDLTRRIAELELNGGIKDQTQVDLSVLGLRGVGFNELAGADQAELLSAIEKELYRSLHPDRFGGLGRDVSHLQDAATKIIQLKIAAIGRLRNRYAIRKYDPPHSY
ncbi:MAG TPA: hypothetical protein VMR81_07875 [Patescibacteria group bacterium]|nr:hypothetical protein [Patescibacteria group bacterium]